MEQKEELFELYMQDLDLYITSYELMGRLLDRKNVSLRVKTWKEQYRKNEDA